MMVEELQLMGIWCVQIKTLHCAETGQGRGQEDVIHAICVLLLAIQCHRPNSQFEPAWPPNDIIG